MMTEVNIEDLIKHGEVFNGKMHNGRDWKLHVVSSLWPDLFEWQNTSLMLLQSQYPNHPQTFAFKKLIDEDKQQALYTTYQAQMGILKAFSKLKPSSSDDIDSDLLLSHIFNNFSRFVHQLKRKRHNGRECFISDEYDVQDLLHAVLKLHFDDVRPEVWTPQYAGSSNRMDFLINDNQTAIEVKYAKDSHKDKQIGDELLIDLAKYSEYPNCKSLYCFIYDPDYCISNPKGLENDLNNKSTDSFKVKVFVRPLE
jgi:hypothetical protein